MLFQVGGLQCKGLLEKMTLPIMAEVDRGRQHMFQRDSNLFLTRNRCGVAFLLFRHQKREKEEFPVAYWVISN